MRLARIYAVSPLTGPYCAAEMLTIAFVTDPMPIRTVLAHIGESTRPPRPASAHDPPAWASDIDAGEPLDPQGEPAGTDALAIPEPEYVFDQRVAW